MRQLLKNSYIVIAALCALAPVAANAQVTATTPAAGGTQGQDLIELLFGPKSSGSFSVATASTQLRNMDFTVMAGTVKTMFSADPRIKDATVDEVKAGLNQFILETLDKEEPAPKSSQTNLGDKLRVSSGMLYVQGLGFKTVPSANLYPFSRLKHPKKDKIIEAIAEMCLAVANTRADNNEREVLTRRFRAVAKAHGPQMVSVLAAQDDPAAVGSLKEAAWSFNFGWGGEADSKFFVGVSYALDPLVLLTVGATFADDAKAKSRLAFGIGIDSRIFENLFGSKKAKAEGS